MSRGSIRKTTIVVPRIEDKSGKTATTREATCRKGPTSERAGFMNLDAAFNSLDDVSFLRLPQVKAITGLSKTSIYELIRGKDFPAPVRLGPRAVAWLKCEIRQWALRRVETSRSAA